jgi:hypothetical protein
MLEGWYVREEEYNPLDYKNLTRNVVEELMRRDPTDLPPFRQFLGAGVYALFYTGDLEFYAPIASAGLETPIYVGKAVPAGARKGTSGKQLGRPLFQRLTEHGRSIDAAVHLSLADFACRYLVVTPLWITMAERFLIEHYQPLWNVRMDGFGNHPPGSGRPAGEVSWWDALHPGRDWARRLQPTRSREQAIDRVREFFRLRETQPEAIARMVQHTLDVGW